MKKSTKKRTRKAIKKVIRKPTKEGLQLKEYRRALGLSQTDFGKMIGLSRTTIMRLETGENMPKPSNMEKICKALGLTYTKFFKLKDNEKIVFRLRIINSKLKKMNENELDYVNSFLDTFLRGKDNH